MFIGIEINPSTDDGFVISLDRIMPSWIAILLTRLTKAVRFTGIIISFELSAIVIFVGKELLKPEEVDSNFSCTFLLDE